MRVVYQGNIRVVCAIRGKLFVLIPRLNDAVGQGIISGNYYEGSSDISED